MNDNKKTSRLAKLSLVCLGISILSFFLFALTVAGFFVLLQMIFFPLAFVLAILSLIVITIRRKVAKGYMISILVIILSLPANYVMYRLELVVRKRIEREKNNKGTYNLRILGKELRKYTNNNNGYLPEADKWCEILIEHNKDLTEDNFRHPWNPVYGPQPKPLIHPDFVKVVRRVNPSFKLPTERKLNLEGEINFAFNKNVSGLPLEEIAPDTVLLFEANGDWNLNGGPELLETRRHKHNVIGVVLASGEMINYMFYYNAYRSYEDGQMHYKELQWYP
jgi:hypothetical protein